MFYKTAFIALALAVTSLTGCKKEPETLIEALEQAEARGEKPRKVKMPSARDQYRPAAVCAAPPCELVDPRKSEANAKDAANRAASN
jgi:hypothetical protein